MALADSRRAGCAPGALTLFLTGRCLYGPRAMSDLPRLAALPPGPFARLATLLGDVKPGKPPISLAVGDPAGTVPEFVKEALAEGVAGFGNYPAISGTEDWRQAAAGWLN